MFKKWIELATLSKMDLTFDKYKSISLKKWVQEASMHLQFLQLKRKKKNYYYICQKIGRTDSQKLHE